MDWRSRKMAARPLTDEEVQKVLAAFDGVHALRNQALFLMLMRTGFRISEALSLYVTDVFQHGKVVDIIGVTKQNMKGKRRSRSIHLHKSVQDALYAFLTSRGDVPLGRVFDISRTAAWRAFNGAFKAACIPHPYGTHACRKTFAQNIYERSGHDYMLTSRALGHESIATTQKYLSVNEDRLRKLVVGE